MRRQMLVPAISSTLLLIAAAPGGADRRDPPPAKLVGEPVNCIPTNRIVQTQVRNDRTIDFLMRGRPDYRNTLPDDCPMLGMQRGFSYRSDGNQLCTIDTIRVLPPGGAGIPGPTCGIGQFQPIILVKATR